ncbi:hypothetical protein SAMN06265222_101558 [Neorhodopirellula lusitana]|uniref:Uncharacterized protein n=1 Tax=Neorhodopirellula lusitana TaxID=445327 RepID=A0ABY1PPR4_9BACT|nr:hypothetical protein [Neorhodopirellula lusitana]SMP41286.1 hypothetical protein SAMN06265222_101558 [Neorhodopirellula lusitana]
MRSTEVVFGFVLGVIAAIPIVLFGFRFFEENTIPLVVGFAGFLIAVCLLFGVLFFFRDRILMFAFKTTQTNLEEAVSLIGSSIHHVASGNSNDAINDVTHVSRILAARYSYFAVRRWMLATVFGLLASFAAFASCALLYRQNSILVLQDKKLGEQNELLKAEQTLIKRQLTPRISVVTGGADENDANIPSITILNNGGEAINLSVESVSRFSAAWVLQRTATTELRKTYPIALTSGCYKPRFQRLPDKHVLVEFEVSDEFQILYDDINTGFLDESLNSRDRYPDFFFQADERRGLQGTIDQFLVVRYEDLFGDSHVIRFSLPTNSWQSSVPVSDSEWERVSGAFPTRSGMFISRDLIDALNIKDYQGEFEPTGGDLMQRIMDSPMDLSE